MACSEMDVAAPHLPGKDGVTFRWHAEKEGGVGARVGVRPVVHLQGLHLCRHHGGGWQHRAGPAVAQWGLLALGIDELRKLGGKLVPCGQEWRAHVSTHTWVMGVHSLTRPLIAYLHQRPLPPPAGPGGVCM